MDPQLVITDLDNTLYNWIDYFAPCFRAMVAALEQRTKVGEEELFRQFREVYARYKDPEYSRAPYELELLRHECRERRDQLAHAAFAAFTRARRHHLSAYPSVLNTLRWLKLRNVTIIGVSNAPVREVLLRIRYLRIHGFLDSLVAWQGVSANDYYAAVNIARRSLIDLHVLSDGFRKPNVKAYFIPLAAHGHFDRRTVWVIGDSITIDLFPAQQIGARTAWARYGQNFQSENFETISRLTFWDRDRIAATYSTDSLTPDAVLENFGQLPAVISRRQRTSRATTTAMT